MRPTASQPSVPNDPLPQQVNQDVEMTPTVSISHKNFFFLATIIF